MAAPDVGLDPVEYHVKLLAIVRRERVRLPLGRAVARVAILQVKQYHGVTAVNPESVDLLDLELRPEVHVAVPRPIVIFEIVDQRTVVELAEEEGRSKAAMAHDQVRLQVGGLSAGFIDALGVRHRVLEAPRKIMGLLGGPALRAVLDAAHAVVVPGRLLRDEGAAIT